MRQRTLRLAKETLHELTTADLASVAGGSGLTCTICNNSDFKECFTGVNCLPTLDSCITGTTHPTQ